MTFMEKMAKKIAEGKHLCVGLDPDRSKIPAGVSIAKFIQCVVEATAPFTAVFKPNIAFFEARGSKGTMEYEQTIVSARIIDPEMPIIGDWKRGDIGATNIGYVQAGFDLYEVDAMTVHPYLGGETMTPFLDRVERGIIVLCRTSNPGAGEFQDLICDVSKDPIFGCGDIALGQECAPLYQVVARNVARDWNVNGNCGLVVGATYPDELVIVRQIAQDIFLLIPGVGKQGGDLEASVRAAVNPKIPADFVINVSSGILYAYLTEQFQTDPGKFDEAAAAAAEYYDNQIREILVKIE